MASDVDMMLGQLVFIFCFGVYLWYLLAVYFEKNTNIYCTYLTYYDHRTIKKTQPLLHNENSYKIIAHSTNLLVIPELNRHNNEYWVTHLSSINIYSIFLM